MKTTVEYLDAVKQKLGIESDYAAAKALSMTRAGISKYRLGRTYFDDMTAVRVATILDLDPMEVISAANAERARDDSAREFWENVWGKVTGATVATAMAVGLAAAPSVAEAATIQPIVSSLHVM
ncbi:hypothetical protein A8D62_10110 [Burkholderia cenocepacia]|uniref:DUF3693 domain-containing protein n=1 Tax=Burkholderia TaxID=32008 RepID=UPI0009B5A619|nr:DUF3693 domain-containing protein [Burkholderia cenocepacia]ONN91534.1 hypothetical protein A8D63_11305 [Burkholderia cenocepacia]ONN94780.1 hypothetical protein A8D62_10110 [Burkholderia cenocepacia]